MKAKWAVTLVVVALGVLLTTAAWAQPSGGPRGMRDQPKRKLEHFVLSLGRLEKSGQAKLSSAQAKKIVTAISPWRKKATMTMAQASELQRKLAAVLTSAQKKEIQSLRPPRGRRRDGMGRDGMGRDERGRGELRREGRESGREGGPGGAQNKEFRQRMEKMRGFFTTYNPFYPASSYKAVQSMPARMQEGFRRRSIAIGSVLMQLSKKAGKA